MNIQTIAMDVPLDLHPFVDLVNEVAKETGAISGHIGSISTRWIDPEAPLDARSFCVAYEDREGPFKFFLKFHIRLSTMPDAERERMLKAAPTVGVARQFEFAGAHMLVWTDFACVGRQESLH